MKANVPTVNTSGRMAAILEVTPSRVSHILRTRQHIKPSAYAGNVALYNSTALAQVRYEITKQDTRRAKETQNDE
jgi:hypothetical protein